MLELSNISENRLQSGAIVEMLPSIFLPKNKTWLKLIVWRERAWLSIIGASVLACVYSLPLES